MEFTHYKYSKAPTCEMISQYIHDYLIDQAVFNLQPRFDLKTHSQSFKMATRYLQRLRDTRSIQEVPIGGVQFVTFQQRHAIGTSRLRSYSAVIIASRYNAILVYIPPLPSVTQVPGTGDNNTRFIINQVQAHYNTNRNYFPSSET